MVVILDGTLTVGLTGVTFSQLGLWATFADLVCPQMKQLRCT